MALTEAGPQQYRPEGKQKSHDGLGPLQWGQAGAGVVSMGVGSAFLLESLTIAGLLRRGVQHLPASVSGREVLSGHPALIPDMEVPEGEARGVSVK